MSKLFNDQNVAQKLAVKLASKDGKEYEVYELGGKFGVRVKGAEVAQHSADNVADVQPSNTAPKPVKEGMTEPVTLVCPVAKETKVYIITGPMGDRPTRWFEKKRLMSWTPTEDGKGFVLVLKKSGVVSRKLASMIAA